MATIEGGSSGVPEQPSNGVDMSCASVSSEAWATPAAARPIVSENEIRWRAPPLAFVENQGQWDTVAHFVARLGPMTTRVEPDAIVLQLAEPRRSAMAARAASRGLENTDRDAGLLAPRRGVVVRLAFEDASPAVQISPSSELPGYFNYFLGNDPSRWLGRVPGYGVVTYQGLYEGVDLVLHEREGRLEYDLRLEPGTDLRDVVIRCEGIEDLFVDARGSLVLATALGPIVQDVPRTWEECEDGERVPVACSYRVIDGSRYGFEVVGRHASRPLVIDPGLVWATFLGGLWSDIPARIAEAANGDVLVMGITQSPDFPTTPGAYDEIGNAGFSLEDQCITRLTAAGDALVYSTFVGGSGIETIYGAVVDDQERITFVGTTFSSDYPTTPGAFQPTFGGQNSDAVVAQLSAAGDALLYATYLGGFNPGTAGETAVGVVVRDDGTIVVSGGTCAADFPVTLDAMDPTFEPLCDVYISVLDPSLSGSAQLVYSSFLFDGGLSFLALEGDGSILGVGHTNNPVFPITPGAFDGTFAGGFSVGTGLVCRLAPDLKSISAATFLDALIGDAIFAPPGSITLALDNVQASLLTPGSYDTTFNGSSEVIIGRLSDSLDTWEWGTLIGGNSFEGAAAIDIDPSGNVLITGSTSSANFPVTPGAYDTVYSGGLGDAFVACLSSDGSQLLYGSYLGPSGAASAHGQAIAAVGDAEAVVAGDGAGPQFPVTSGAFDTTFNGGIGDGFVVRLKLVPAWTSVGEGVAGSNGVPKLVGGGPLCAGESTTLTLVRGKSNGVATLVLGLTQIDLPFKGGTLIPSPDLLFFGLPLDGAGKLVISAPWPAGIPSGFTMHLQGWIPDAAAVQGLAATNGLTGTVP